MPHRAQKPSPGKVVSPPGTSRGDAPNLPKKTGAPKAPNLPNATSRVLNPEEYLFPGQVEGEAALRRFLGQKPKGK